LHLRQEGLRDVPGEQRRGEDVGGRHGILNRDSRRG
jgi:hypothetical protein